MAQVTAEREQRAAAEPEPPVLVQSEPSQAVAGEASADPDALRDEVRRAVEQARAELEAGTLKPESQDALSSPAGHGAEEPVAASVEPRSLMEQASPGLPPTQPLEHGFTFPPEMERPLPQPSSLVIDDPAGRVELVRVYETLYRVGCASQAVLLNYTPHSVTIGFGSRELPSAEDLVPAVEAIFERSCEARLENNRLTLHMGDSQSRVA
jgi:hypothetical protein